MPSYADFMLMTAFISRANTLLEEVMTISEEITSLISQKYFLKQYIFDNLLVKENDLSEKELCDCLLEFSNAYICIQIKEKDASSNLSPREWFAKKVLKNAKKQIRDTFEFIRNEHNTIFSKKIEFCADRSKSIIPIIVFVNPDVKYYQRITTSKYIDVPVNIFSYEDFKTMMETIIMPYDIINYVAYRTVFKESERGKIIIDEASDINTLIARPNTEQDYAQLFLARSYISQLKEYDIHESEIEFYNEIVSSLNESNGAQRCKLIEGLMRIDYVGAARVAKNWSRMILATKEDNFVVPFWISLDDRLYLFAVHPRSMPDKEYYYRVNLCVTYLKYKGKYKMLHLLTFQSEAADQYSVSLADANLDEEFPYEELLPDAIDLFEGE